MGTIVQPAPQEWAEPLPTVTVAVLLPTRGRAKQMTERVTALLDGALPDEIELVVVLAVCEDDHETIEETYNLVRDTRVTFTTRPANSTAVYGWNLAHDIMRSADWFVLGADDIIWHEGWLESALYCASKNKAQVIGLNDGHTNLQHYGAHYMVHRDFIRNQLDGFFIPPEYKSWWFDREICERANQLGLYAPCHEAMAEHLHPEWNTAQMDATYEAGYELHDADRELYQTRKAAGWKVDKPAKKGKGKK